MKNNIHTIRENLGLTQTEFSNKLNIPVKSIRNWEQNIRVPSDYIVEMIVDCILRKKLEDNTINDEKYIPSFLMIKEKGKNVFSKYNIDKAYLYGSYAQGTQTPLSDIDLYMISDIDDLDYFGVIEDLRSIVNKRIDLLSNKTVKADSPILNEIERTGILIYERKKYIERIISYCNKIERYLIKNGTFYNCWIKVVIILKERKASKWKVN
ncbi:nucleotidyltransferase domain-containing protein [Acholeplasma laidlawii]|uniref:nucleotidyltransferase domain-containing protein n=1 Tax=Acholeplasma laidlawii TaxID=2148 RepID=UPI0021F6E572|nr:nucleotidyltransferase domain-containing protein [Acholeplasma laidlawii]